MNTIIFNLTYCLAEPTEEQMLIKTVMLLEMVDEMCPQPTQWGDI